jgi:WD40-like Beta Propeller Repeat
MLVRRLRRCGWLGVLGPMLLAAVLVLAGPAQAAFPGRDGLLAIQPSKGPGIVLINANGRGERRVCAQPGESCGVTSPSRLVRPRWAPDGGRLLIDRTDYSPSGAFEVIYPDGSCLACLGGPSVGVDASFTTNPTLYTAVTPPDAFGLTAGGALLEYSIDGLKRSVVIAGGASDPVWSSRGELALVRDGWIWAGSPDRLRRMVRGSAPSWSPDARRIVFVRNGWLMIGRVRGRIFRRLIRGAAPAWSPNGSWIAFFDKRHRLSLVRATGGRARGVGDVTGWTVDWQPLPAKPPAACLTPSGSNVLATSDTAIITSDHRQSSTGSFFTSAYLGCLRADGRERLLASYPYPGYATEDVVETSVAGTYAALATNTTNSHDQTMSSRADLFDLRTGLPVPDRGGEGSMCVPQSSPPCASNIDQLVLGSDAVSAVHTTVRDANCAPTQESKCKYTVEQIQDSDSTGIHTLDSITEPDGSPAALTNLVLTGDTLTWNDNGTRHSAHLQP